METKQTAVEWILDWMSKNQYFIGNDLLKAVEQAKEMERQQIVEARVTAPLLDTCSKNEYIIEAEQYYNETYNN
jgi:hypothetical protein